MLNLEKLKEIFKDYPYIASAYLFGSYASGKVNPMSDLDIAILLKDNASKGRELIHKMDYMAYGIEKALQTKEVDLIELNNKGLIFQYNVLRTGKLIYDADPLFRRNFVTRLITTYCDFEPTIRFIKRFHLQGIKNRVAKI
jgi:predicted nucleotidyltransferase